jgi:1,4-dihydroxy-2-naphthoyl-CoA hydrolase
MAPESDARLSETLQDLMPFARTLGIVVLRYDADEVRARLQWSPSLCTSGGVLHGGAVMALADSTGGACAYLNLPEGAQATTTVESKTNFLRAVREGSAVAISRPLHVGNTTIVIETDVLDSTEHLVARVVQTQLVVVR